MVTAKTYLGRRYAKELGVRFNRINGPVLLWAASPANEADLEAEVHVKSQTAKAKATLRLDALRNTEMTVHAAMPYQGADAFKPALVLGAKYSF